MSERGLRDYPMPPPLVAGAAAWLDTPADQRPEPVAPKRSATVLVIRDASDGVEVFMQHRTTTMKFAPNMLVFPGGGIDRTDAAADVPWAGPGVAEWTARLDTGDDAATRAVVCAAVREVFEECGVLLAGPDADALIDDVSSEAWQERRRALEARDLSFSAMLAGQGLVLRSDLLVPFGHWITPECEPRRYDTHLFVAAMPHGQEADDRTSEAVSARWERPADVIRRYAQDPTIMLPPTLWAVEQLVDAGGVADVLGRTGDLRLRMPHAAQTDAGDYVMRVLA